MISPLSDQPSLNTQYVLAQTSEYMFPVQVEYQPVLPSTNDALKTRESDDFVHGMCLVTGHQTAGRGQHRREWKTTPGENLTFSLGLKPPARLNVHNLLHVAGLSVAKALDETGLHPSIKWPNDVLVNGRKICGILTEATYQGNKLRRYIIGTGINVNQTEFEEELSTTATSVLNEGADISREDLLSAFFKLFSTYYKMWESQRKVWLDEYNSYLQGFDKLCAFEQPEAGKPSTRPLNLGQSTSQSLTGNCRGIQPDGRLKVDLLTGESIYYNHEDIRIYPIS